MPYLATTNVPGYLPDADDPPTFETAAEAWDYLASERTLAEDQSEGEGYSPTRETLCVLGTKEHWTSSDLDDPGADVRAWLASHGLAPDGTGTIYGPTPGYDGDHDLGLGYSVTFVDDEGVPA